MSADTVIKKIQEKAAAEAAAIENAGKAEAASLRESILADAQKRADEITQRGKNQADMIIRSSNQQAALDNKIGYLNYKHELLNKTKESAKQELNNYNDRQWGNLFTKLVTEYAMNGNVLIKASKQDIAKFRSVAFCSSFGGEGSLTEYWSKKLSKKRGETVTFTVAGQPEEDIFGGFILCGDDYDIDLSYDAIMDEVFEQYEKEIADRLFGTKASVK